MNDDFTQDSGATQTQGDYSAPQPEAEGHSGSYGQNDTRTGAIQQPTGSYGQNDTRTGAIQQPTGSFGQSDIQTGVYQQQSGSYGQNMYSQQNPYGDPGTNPYTNTNSYANSNPYSGGSPYSNPYQQNVNKSQNMYYGQASPNGDDGIGFGVASMVLGILSIFTFTCCINYILAILAIIFGIVQMVKSSKKEMAIAGIITAVISLVISTVFWGAAVSEGTNGFSDFNFDSYQEEMMQQDFMEL